MATPKTIHMSHDRHAIYTRCTNYMFGYTMEQGPTAQAFDHAETKHRTGIHIAFAQSLSIIDLYHVSRGCAPCSERGAPKTGDLWLR
jgi:hypothetical protein